MLKASYAMLKKMQCCRKLSQRNDTENELELAPIEPT